jgi:hypothetical protein
VGKCLYLGKLAAFGYLEVWSANQMTTARFRGVFAGESFAEYTHLWQVLLSALWNTAQEDIQMNSRVDKGNSPRPGPCQ